MGKITDDILKLGKPGSILDKIIELGAGNLIRANQSSGNLEFSNDGGGNYSEFGSGGGGIDFFGALKYAVGSAWQPSSTSSTMTDFPTLGTPPTAASAVGGLSAPGDGLPSCRLNSAPAGDYFFFCKQQAGQVDNGGLDLTLGLFETNGSTVIDQTTNDWATSPDLLTLIPFYQFGYMNLASSATFDLRIRHRSNGSAPFAMGSSDMLFLVFYKPS